MKYVSLFSGIEAASCAWRELGWEPIAFAEVEPFCCSLLARRYPHVPNLGDVTKVDWSHYEGTVDLVVGGSPCQSFSVAGARTGRAGQSGLMAEYIRAVREIGPRWFIWENVPGALTVESGAAFGQLLGEMDVLGYGLCWRILDAQFFGVAQRRRRVFLVGCLGDPRRAAEVLIEPEGLCRDTPASKDKRKSLAADAKSRPGESMTTEGKPSHVICMGDANTRASIDEDLSGTLKVYGDPPIAAIRQPSHLVIRKLMPVECERLQGFPDGWTDIETNGKPACDAARYRALGNSMAVPVMRWIGERIALADEMKG